VTKTWHLTRIQDGCRHLGFHQRAILRRLWMDSHQIWYADVNRHLKVESMANTNIFLKNKMAVPLFCILVRSITLVCP